MSWSNFLLPCAILVLAVSNILIAVAYSNERADRKRILAELRQLKHHIAQRSQ